MIAPSDLGMHLYQISALATSSVQYHQRYYLEK